MPPPIVKETSSSNIPSGIDNCVSQENEEKPLISFSPVSTPSNASSPTITSSPVIAVTNSKTSSHIPVFKNGTKVTQNVEATITPLQTTTINEKAVTNSKSADSSSKIPSLSILKPVLPNSANPKTSNKSFASKFTNSKSSLPIAKTSKSLLK